MPWLNLQNMIRIAFLVSELYSGLGFIIVVGFGFVSIIPYAFILLHFIAL